jgi:cholesterol transport system auxiliary component
MKLGKALALSTLLLAACSALQPPRVERPALYLLDAQLAASAPRPQRGRVLAVEPPRARAGFATAQIAYVRQPHKLEYYANNRWVDTPARMLAPLLAQALALGGGFRAVVQAPSPLAADLRLDSELIRLQQDFSTLPSRVQLTLRAQLLDVNASRILATEEFDIIEGAPSDDAYGGAIAANRALQRLLQRLNEFSVAASAAR